MKKAIEVEYWVSDRDGKLTTPGTLTESSQYVEEEFVDPMIELKTPPCDSYRELERTFLDQLDTLLTAAAEQDKQLIPLGTPINGTPIDQRPSDRTKIQNSVIGSELQYANYCAGTHLHFEKRNVTDQLNVLIALDPSLATLNSSPYFQGKPVANGARSHLYRERCYGQFPKHGQLWDYVETVAEWEDRLEECYEEFKAAAMAAGESETAIEEHFSHDSVVWTPVRLRDAMPTVEWRSPDISLPSQVLELVKQLDEVMTCINDSVVTIDGHRGNCGSNAITLPEFEAVEQYTDRAIHDGLESNAVRQYLQRMGFDLTRFSPLSAQIGGESFVSVESARKLRSKYAERMRSDVASMRTSQSV